MEKCKGKKKDYYMSGRNIIPERPPFQGSFKNIINLYAGTCFEARNVADGAFLFERMIRDEDVIWLGIAGAGIAGGLGGHVIELIEKGFIDVICTTGAQAYHDLHFAFGLPVKQGHPKVDDNEMRKAGVTRIFDINITEEGTLKIQDEIIRDFCKSLKSNKNFSSADFNYALGNYVLKNAKYPGRSFMAWAAKYGVPVFYDSASNHSIGMNIAALYARGEIKINLNPSLDILESAAIVFASKTTGFIELGGGGPKNFIQQTSPTINQILGIDFEGADRGLQITTAIERDGGLSGCTFQEGVTWGKYKDAKKDLVQIFGEYSVIFPLVSGYAIENCKTQNHKRIMDKKKEIYKKLIKAM